MELFYITIIKNDNNHLHLSSSQELDMCISTLLKLENELLRHDHPAPASTPWW